MNDSTEKLVELVEIEFELSPLCLGCDGTAKTRCGKYHVYWCIWCGGSGSRITCTIGLQYELRATREPAPYKDGRPGIRYNYDRIRRD